MGPLFQEARGLSQAGAASCKGQSLEHVAQQRKIRLARIGFTSALLIQQVGQFEDLVREKRQKVEYEKVYRQIPAAIAKVVLKMIALVFLRC